MFEAIKQTIGASNCLAEFATSTSTSPRELTGLVDSALELNPKNTAAIVTKATLLYESGDLTGAIGLLRKVEAQQSSNVQIKSMLAYLYEATGNKSAARAKAMQVMALGGTPPATAVGNEDASKSKPAEVDGTLMENIPELWE